MEENYFRKCLMLLLLLISTPLLAQERSVSGVVVDENDFPLPGVTIQVKDQSLGTITNFDGAFELRIPSEEGTILVFSFIGYETREIDPENQTSLYVTLQEDMQALDEVVVTALGIKREEKRLGFSQATVDGEDIAHAAPINWSSGLKGKVAGLNIVSAGSGPINSQQITLRGNSSFDLTNNYALIVVDGIPVNTQMTTSGSGSAYMGEDSPIDYGNGISDLNFNDIESISVLKGPGAAALYGSRAANGAIMITTKSGKQTQGLGITLTSSTSFDVIQRWPIWQYRYGQGNNNTNADGELYYSYRPSEDGPNTGSTSSAWGPEFKGQYYYQYDPVTQAQSAERRLWRAYENTHKDFWRTGITTQNNISLQGGGERGSMRASIGHTKNEWIMPNTGFERITASLNSSYQISDRIRLGSSLNYNTKWSDNLPSTGYNNGSIAYFMILHNPSVSLDWYRDIWEHGQENIKQIQPFSSYIDNPFLIAYEALNTMDSHQIIGNVFADIDLGSNLNLLLRTAINSDNQQREQKRPYSINRYAEGYYQLQDVFSQEINSDFLLTYDPTFDGDFDISVSVGGNSRNQKRSLTNASVTGLVVPGVYKLSNGKNSPALYKSDYEKEVNSLYGLASFSFKDQIFLDITGRNDWSSTLPKSNNSFFYPSANLSMVLSDMLGIQGRGMNYLKYRFSYAQVGNDTDPYQTRKYYNQNNFPSSATVDNTLYNADFKPEISTSYETGIEARFLDSRLGLDATVYQITTKNQIVDIPMNWSTGYSAAIMNAGEVRNRGIELSLRGKVFENDNFSWSSTLSWSTNQGEVMNLPDNIDNQYYIDEGGQAKMIAKVGGSPTAIYGYGFVRSPDGQIVYDGGIPAYPATGDFLLIGDAMPDWKAGLYNQLNFGNFALAVTLDGQYGGIVYSQTYHKTMEQGKLTDSYMGRETMEIIGDGVVLNPDGTYAPNTTPVATQEWYKRYYRRANVESNSFDASFLKLREVSLSYNLPRTWLQNVGIQGLQLSVYGQNLATVSDFPIYDPETAALNGNRIMPGVEMGQMPSPATYGFNIKMNL